MIYKIFLDNIKIGESLLEKADAPMGVVFGMIKLIDTKFNYDSISKYCKKNSVKTDGNPKNKSIFTEIIPKLTVLNEKGTEIKGMGCFIAGMDEEGFEINIIGIPYPFYKEEFPHHVREYEKMFQ